MTTDEAPHELTMAWDEVAGSSGRTFLGEWFHVDRDRLDLFDRATYTDQNRNPMAEGVYPDGLVEGFHLLALLDHLTNAVLRVDDPRWSGWNYGLDRVRFVSPVTIHDGVRVRGRVARVEPRGEDLVLVLECAVEVEEREKPGMVATWRVLWSAAS